MKTFDKKGAYTCQKCGKLTRETGCDESMDGLCYHCMREGEIDILYDNDEITTERYEELIKELKEETAGRLKK